MPGAFVREVAEQVVKLDPGSQRDVRGLDQLQTRAARSLIRYTASWLWVQNYNGEERAGAVRPGPIYARIWIDQAMKKKMGF